MSSVVGEVLPVAVSSRRPTSLARSDCVFSNVAVIVALEHFQGESQLGEIDRRPLWLGESAAVCDRDRFRATENVQLGEDAAQVPFHRGWRRPEGPRTPGCALFAGVGYGLGRQARCDKLTRSPAQSSETAIRRGVELATFSSKPAWLAFSRPHAIERI